MAAFKCPKCGKTISVSKFRTYFKEGKQQNIDLETKKEIICEDCKISMQFVPEKGEFGIAYSQFSGLSPLEKQKLLRKRSNDDAKKQKYRQADYEKDHYNA